MNILLINFADACNVYDVSVNPNINHRWYRITSDNPISRGEVEKIQRILGTYRDLQIVEESRELRERKFQNYVAYLPENRWGEVAEYQNFLQWKERLEKTQKSLAEIQTEYGITDICVESSR
jgi:hypothetical protein